MGMSLFRGASIHWDNKVGGMRLHLLVIQHTDRILSVVLRQNYERDEKRFQNCGPYVGIYPVTDSVLNIQIFLQVLAVCAHSSTTDNTDFDVLYSRERQVLAPITGSGGPNDYRA